MFFWSDKNGVVGSKLSFKYMYVLPQTPRAWGGGYSPGPPTRALSWNRCGTLSGPQTPLLLTPPLIPNPGPAPVDTNNPQGMQLGRSKNRIENKFVNRKLEKKGGWGWW